MNEDMRRPHVVIAEDLAEELAKLPHAADLDAAAAGILDAIGVPVSNWTVYADGHERPGIRVDADELAGALRGTYGMRLTGRGIGGDYHGKLTSPEGVAAAVLKAIAAGRRDAALEEINVRGGVTGAATEDDDEPGGTRIAAWQLADWLKNHEVTIGPYTGRVEHPEALAETILEDVTGEAHPMPVDAEIHCPGCTCHITEQTGFAPPDRPVKVLLAVQDLFARIDKNSRKRVLDWLMSEISELPPRWP